MNPVFIDGQTQVHGCKWRNFVVMGRAGRGLLLDSVMTADKTWACYFMPKSKRSSMQWRRAEFRNNEEVIQDVQEWLHWQPKDFFLSGIRKLPDRWPKCITNQGNYVEK